MNWFTEKKTPAQWKKYLSDEDRTCSLFEYAVQGLMYTAGAVIDLAHNMRHLEGMVGAIDDAFARHDPNYAASAKIREALDAKREEAIAGRRPVALSSASPQSSNGTGEA